MQTYEIFLNVNDQEIKYIPACILLACACVVDMNSVQSGICLGFGVILTVYALRIPTPPLIYNSVMEAPEPIFAVMQDKGEETSDGNGEFDYY